MTTTQRQRTKLEKTLILGATQNEALFKGLYSSASVSHNVCFSSQSKSSQKVNKCCTHVVHKTVH